MAEPQNDGQERSQPATPRRIETLRQDGQVPRSQDLSATVLMLAVGVGLFVVGPWLVEDLATLMSTSFRALGGMTAEGSVHYLFGETVSAFFALSPLLVIAAAAAMAAPLAVGGWVFSAKPLTPDLSRIDPIKGMTRRVFSVRGLVEMGKAAAKFVVIAALATIIIVGSFGEAVALAQMPVLEGLSSSAGLLVVAFIALASGMILVAAIDVPFQRWNFARQHRMSFTELKQESRTEDGAPELRAKVRARQREVAERRMLNAIPTADVVITNPTHFAVALSYDAGSREAAPRLVASGADLMAAQIRRLALANDVPLVEAPMLARAVYHSTRVGDEIPVGLYAAVAAVLKYAYRLRGRVGYDDAVPPRNLPIPEELRFD